MRGFPAAEKIRKAVERAICGSLDTGAGSFNVEMGDDEIEFRPGAGGSIEVCVSNSYEDADPAERTFKFRVRVELVDVV